MRALPALSLLIALLLWGPGCIVNDDTAKNGSVPSGAFEYAGFDSTGKPITKGWLTLIYGDSSRISGSWHLDPIVDPQRVGHPTGSGTLRGSATHDVVCVDLFPGYADHNLLLRGTVSGNQFVGEWHRITLVGETNHGTFRAERN